ncbi:MAG: CPBP family intramembrane metalloprotease [Anaerolineales bacterium]|nr:CPBP family intramembrane metalloprotease [Anaerolineales bacterium]
MQKENAYPQQSLLKSTGLHILPGALVTLGFILFKPLLDASGYPPLFAFLLAILFVDLPVMWGILLYEGWKKNGRLSLDGVVLFRDKLTWKRFLLVFIGAFVVAYLLIMLAAPLTNILTTSVFSRLPEWMFLEEQSQYQAYAKNVLIMVFTFQLVLTGVVLPWTEELYFRGYLLPRITRYGKWVPLIGGVLFGLYHSWQMFGFFSVFLLGVVLGYVVWKTRDIRLSISLHVAANAFARLAFLLAAIAM